MDHLYSLQRYAGEEQVYYWNLRDEKDLRRAGFFEKIPFDAVVFHYTFLSMRHNWPVWRELYPQITQALEKLQGTRVMMTQDDYAYTNDLRRFAKDFDVGLIFTVVKPEEYRLYYAEALNRGAAIHTVYTGYIDAQALQTVAQMRKKMGEERKIDIGYRARRLPYNYGRAGLLKTEIAKHFHAALPRYPDLKVDIDTTGNTENAKLGNDWLFFLMECRTMLGCLSGSSLMDPDGAYIQATSRYLQEHPSADFYEVEAACFPGVDGNTSLAVVGPRNFECAMTETCQVLLEGDYGFLQPGVHYIELKQDFSNMDEVLGKIQDHTYCRQIARRCYKDVVEPEGAENPYTYAWFARFVFERIKQMRMPLAKTQSSVYWGQVRLRMALGQGGNAMMRSATHFGKRVQAAWMGAYYAGCRFLEKRPGIRRLLGRSNQEDASAGDGEDADTSV